MILCLFERAAQIGVTVTVTVELLEYQKPL